MLRKILVGVVLFVFLASIGAGVGYWMVFSSNTPEYTGVRSVKIPRGSSFETVVDSLSSSGILKRPQTFTWIAEASGWGGQIKAGHYTFHDGASNYALLDTLRRGLQTPIRLTIPPGSRREVVARVVAKQMTFSSNAFLEALADPTLAAELETDTTHLFAYLLPETYFMYWLTDERTVIRKVKQHFDRFYTDLKTNAARDPGLTADEVLRLAAIVEWETGIRDEKPKVAGVYLNRLRDRWRLDADPTVQYAIMQREGKKRRLFFRDYKIDHPYNTYQFRGLPPGPVTNPSPSSISSILNAAEHDYFFFVATGQGGHTFTRTLREHRRAAQEFYRVMRERRQQQQQSE